MKSCLIIAGEQSGEEHCLSFFNQLKELDPSITYFGVGGDGLRNSGLELIYHLKDFSSWGISEVITKIPFYLKAFHKILEEVDRRQCKSAILVDFQTFNLNLAKKLKTKGVDVLYYVAPQAWAWKSWRIKALKNSVHTLFTILPFEKKWFQERGIQNIHSVVHPLYRTYRNELQQLYSKGEKKDFGVWDKNKFNLLLLPGSRNFEVESLLEIFIQAKEMLKESFPNISTSIVLAPTVRKGIYDYFSSHFDQVYSNEQLHQALKQAHFCFAASGTVTLATALFEVPTVVCYRGSLLNEFIYYSLIDYQGYISLANIVHQKKIFPELIQNQATAYNIVAQLQKWVSKKESYQQIKIELSKTKELLSGEDFNLPQYLYNVISSKRSKR